MKTTIAATLLVALAIYSLTTISVIGKPASCSTPTPGGSIPNIAFTLDFSATKTVTLTTVFTMASTDGRPVTYRYGVLTQGCDYVGSGITTGNLAEREVRTVNLDDTIEVPTGFAGEIDIAASLPLTVAHKIVLRATPTLTPLPTATATATPKERVYLSRIER